MNWRTPVAICLIFMGTLIVAYFIGLACVSFKDMDNQPTLGKTYAENRPDPASVAKYKYAFIHRAQFKTEGDFYNSVTTQIEWLWKHDYKVISLEYKYGFNLTQNLILRFAVIKYIKEKK